MLGCVDSFNHVLNFGDRRVVSHQRLVLLETDLRPCDALDGKQCGPHRLNAALSRHAVDDERHRRRLALSHQAGATEDTDDRQCTQLTSSEHAPEFTTKQPPVLDRPLHAPGVYADPYSPGTPLSCSGARRVCRACSRATTCATGSARMGWLGRRRPGHDLRQQRHLIRQCRLRTQS